MSPSPRPGAGWYLNVQVPGQDRWWDGESWTEHTRLSPPPAPPGPPPHDRMRHDQAGHDESRHDWAFPGHAHQDRPHLDWPHPDWSHPEWPHPDRAGHDQAHHDWAFPGWDHPDRDRHEWDRHGWVPRPGFGAPRPHDSLIQMVGARLRFNGARVLIDVEFPAIVRELGSRRLVVQVPDVRGVHVLEPGTMRHGTLTIQTPRRPIRLRFQRPQAGDVLWLRDMLSNVSLELPPRPARPPFPPRPPRRDLGFPEPLHGHFPAPEPSPLMAPPPPGPPHMPPRPVPPVGPPHDDTPSTLSLHLEHLWSVPPQDVSSTIVVHADRMPPEPPHDVPPPPPPADPPHDAETLVLLVEPPTDEPPVAPEPPSDDLVTLVLHAEPPPEEPHDDVLALPTEPEPVTELLPADPSPDDLEDTIVIHAELRPEEPRPDDPEPQPEAPEPEEPEHDAPSTLSLPLITPPGDLLATAELPQIPGPPPPKDLPPTSSLPLVPPPSPEGPVVNANTTAPIPLIAVPGLDGPARPFPATATHGPTWFGPEQSIQVGRFILPGLLYVGRRSRRSERLNGEPAVIEPGLEPVSDEPDWTDGIVNKPSYHGLTPGQRLAYLTWLESGRQHPATPPVVFGFIFFYGLERRVVVDARNGNRQARADIPTIVAEVRRLKTVFQDSPAFQQHADRLIDAADWIAADGALDLEAAPAVPRPEPGPLPIALRRHLGEFARLDKPLPAVWALAWAHCSDEITLPALATRCPEEFEALFRIRYHERHAQGLLIRSTRPPLRLEYETAASDLTRIALVSEIPDIIEALETLHAIAAVAEACAQELEAYSHWLDQHADHRDSLLALLQLPPLLLSPDDRRLADLRAWARTTMGPHDRRLILGADLIHHWSPDDDSLSKKESAELAMLLGVCGFGIEPDVRMGGHKLTSGPAVLFRLTPDSPVAARPAYASAATLIRLAVAVAGADGSTSESEIAHLTAHVEKNLDLEASEKARLRAHLDYLVASGVKLTKLRKRLSSLAKPERRTIGGLVSSLAAADGVITPDEIKLVTKIYDLLGLDTTTAFIGKAPHPAPIHHIPAPSIPQTLAAGLRLPPEPVPAPPVEPTSLAALLQTIFTDDEDAAPDLEPPVRVADLDARHSALVLALRWRKTIDRAEFDTLAASHHVKPEHALGVLNEAGLEVSGKPVLEGKDPLTVNRHAMKALVP